MKERRFLHNLTEGLAPIIEEDSGKEGEKARRKKEFLDFAKYVSKQSERLYGKGVYVEKLIGEGRRSEIGIIAGRAAKLPVEMLCDLGKIISKKINNTNFVKKFKFTLDVGYWLIDRQISGESY